jgi:hypothetical protein
MTAHGMSTQENPDSAREEGMALMPGRSGWAFGDADGGEWLTIYGPAGRRPVLHHTSEPAEEALAASNMHSNGLSAAHVTGVWHAGMTGPRQYAHRITPGTCRKPAGRERGER